MTDSAPFRIAVVGMRHGRQHASVILQRDDCELAGVCDLEADKRIRAAQDLRLDSRQVYEDYEHMLDEHELVATAAAITT